MPQLVLLTATVVASHPGGREDYQGFYRGLSAPITPSVKVPVSTPHLLVYILDGGDRKSLLISSHLRLSLLIFMTWGFCEAPVLYNSTPFTTQDAAV